WDKCRNLLRIREMYRCEFYRYVILRKRFAEYDDRNLNCIVHFARRGVRMKSCRLLLWALVAFSFLSFSSVLAHADGLPPGDPVMQVDDPTCTPTGPTTGVSSGQIFSFTADANGGGCFGFVVVGNADFETMDFQFGQGNAVPADAENCSSDAFLC